MAAGQRLQLGIFCHNQLTHIINLWNTLNFISSTNLWDYAFHKFTRFSSANGFPSHFSWHECKALCYIWSVQHVLIVSMDFILSTLLKKGRQIVHYCVYFTDYLFISWIIHFHYIYYFLSCEGCLQWQINDSLTLSWSNVLLFIITLF